LERTGAAAEGAEELGVGQLECLSWQLGACQEESGGLSRVLNEEQYIVPIGIGLGCVFLTWAFLCLFEPRNRTNNQISFPKN
jgi:hypothetical protein